MQTSVLLAFGKQIKILINFLNIYKSENFAKKGVVKMDKMKIFPNMRWVLALMFIWMMATTAKATDLHLLPIFQFSAQASDLSTDSTADAVEKADYRDRELRQCFGNYRGWTAPHEVNVELLIAICDYIRIQGLRYIHHSDVREKSLHPPGEALDFRFAIPHGVDPDHFFRLHTVGLWYFLLRIGRADWGFAHYHDTVNKFWQVDTGKGEKPNRRWARVNGQYVSFGRGIDELINSARGHRLMDFVHRDACDFALMEMVRQCEIRTGVEARQEECLAGHKNKMFEKLGCLFPELK